MVKCTVSVAAWCIRLVVVGVVMGAAGAAHAQASLSDYLNAKIAEAKRAEVGKQFEVALDAYRQALDKSVPEPEMTRTVLKQRAALYEQIHMTEMAEADLTSALAVEPLDPKLYADRGYFYLRRARYSDAIDDFVTGSRYEPQNPAYMNGVARTLVAQKDYASARDSSSLASFGASAMASS